MAVERAVGLDEQRRLVRCGAPDLACVVAVVQADANHLADGRQRIPQPWMASDDRQPVDLGAAQALEPGG